MIQVRMKGVHQVIDGNTATTIRASSHFCSWAPCDHTHECELHIKQLNSLARATESAQHEAKRSVNMHDPAVMDHNLRDADL